MPSSIPASVELAPVSIGRLGIGEATLRAVAAKPSGAAGLALTALVFAIALVGPAVAPADPFALSGAPLTPPSSAHLMGTDALGRDLFSGILYGARSSLLIALAVGGLAFVVGAAVGLVAGHTGGILDDVLMRGTEIFQVLPRFFLVVVTVALFGAGTDRVILTLGFTSWPVLARVVRGEVVSLRQLEFMQAARASGASRIHILGHQLFPNVLPSLLVLVGLLIGQVLLIEATLGFLGLSDPGAMTWGALAGRAHGFLRVAWWLPFFPGLAIMIAVLAINLFADAISSVLGGH